MGLFKKSEWPDFDFSEIKKRSRLLVIDDNEFTYKKLFERDGYTIEKWDDIDDLPKLEEGYYDLILLDIQGVGKAESPEEQGLGVLKHLRSTNPTQIIIAYSNSDWSLKYQDFFEMADAVLDKKGDYIEFKQKVDNLLKDKFTIDFYIERIISIIRNDIQDVEKTRECIKKAILNKNKRKLEKYLRGITDRKDLINTSIGIAQLAIGIMSL